MFCRYLVIQAGKLGLLQVFLGFPCVSIYAGLKKIESHLNLP
jgi:hypothetical protein